MIGRILLALLLTLSPALARGVGSPGVGLPGPQGDPGPAGPLGATGSAGARGDAGPKGDAGPAGSAGPQGPQGPTGAPGAVGAQGQKGDTGPAGIVPIYGPTGLRTGVKAWMGAVPSANGLWSAPIASAGCSAPPWNVQAQALGVDSTAAGVRVANVSSASATTISGTVTQPATVSLLGVLSLSLFTSGSATVWVEAFCN